MATSIFINNNVTMIVMSRATIIAVKEAFPTELIVEPYVCVMYSLMLETFA
ncbi:hypothetical protein D3C71_2110570 [compost metagenome]